MINEEIYAFVEEALARATSLGLLNPRKLNSLNTLAEYYTNQATGKGASPLALILNGKTAVDLFAQMVLGIPIVQCTACGHEHLRGTCPQR